MKIAIAGYGIEGEANYKYWLGLGADVRIFDEKEPSRTVPEGAEVYIGEDAFTKLDGFDLVVRTAGLNPNKISTDNKVWSSTNEFFAKCPARIIGVTGTKGKGTTCSLITEILRAAGKTVHLVGNIGVPALEELPKIQAEDIVVFELSSFQLWDLEKSPETAVVLMIEPDHMDVHASMEEYIAAKGNIGKFQAADDLLVYHPTNESSAEVAALSPARKKRYMSQEGACIENSQISIDGNKICAVSEVGLLGAHNLENITAAITAAWNYTQDTDAIKKAVTSFKGLPHRLEFVCELNGVTFINDSFSTGPGATIAALRACSDPLTVIIGGSDKGIDLTNLLTEITNKKPRVILIGSSADSFAEKLRQLGYENFENKGDLKTMSDIVTYAHESTSEGVVLLSPAHASFDMFNNVYDRGNQFKAAVNAL